MAEKANVRKLMSQVVKILRELLIRKNGDLLKHFGGATSAMETLRDEPKRRAEILEGVVKESVALKMPLGVAANTFEIAVANEDILPERLEAVITPDEQARIYSPESIREYLDLDDWRKRKGEPEDKALAGILRLLEVNHLTTKDETIGRFRQRLAFVLPPEEIHKIVMGCQEKALGNSDLFNLLDMVEMVKGLEREEVNSFIDLVFERHGILKKPAPAEPEAPSDAVKAAETPAVTETADIPDDDLVVVTDIEASWKDDKSPQDDGEPEITSEPVAAGDQEIERALDELDLDKPVDQPAAALARYRPPAR